MTAEQLRNSILQEAISGRLVPQDPNGEPASALLARIREEKARLVKEGKLKKKDLVETPITEEEIPFEIPASWEWVRLGYLVDFSKSSSVKASSISPNAWILDLEDIQKNTGVLLRKKRMGETVSISDKHQFKKGNVLYSKLRPYLNKVIVADEDGYCTSEILCFNFGEINNRYAQLFLMSAFFVDYAMKDAYGVKMPRLGSKQGNNALFPLPPLAEQKRIVAKLEELLPIVEQYGKAQKELDELNAALPPRLRQSILQEAISGRLVPQDPNDEPAAALLQRIREEKARLVKEGKLKKKDLVETPITDEEKPFEIPSSWEWVRYQDIADCALGKTKNPNQVEGELCQYLCSINVYWDSVRLNVLKEMLFSDTDKQKYSVEKGDMLICEGGEAGRSAIYEGNISPIYYQNALHRVRFYGGICTRFFLYQMELYKKTGLLTDHIKGETIQHFVSTKLLNLPIPLPPLAEQQRIVAKIEELFAEIDKLK